MVWDARRRRGGRRGTAASARTVEAPHGGAYTLTDLGLVDGVPGHCGALQIVAVDPDVLWIAGQADAQAGAIYAVDHVRDARGHVAGFAGPGVAIAQATLCEGGMARAPDGAMIFRPFPDNALGQIVAGSGAVLRVDELAALGVEGGGGGVRFVPDGFPGAGAFKLAVYDGPWGFCDLALAPAPGGGWDVQSAELRHTLTGGPESFVFVPPGSPLLMDEFSCSRGLRCRVRARCSPPGAARVRPPAR